MSVAASCIALRTEGIVNPIGLANQSPRLRWQLRASGPSVAQTAFQVKVAKTVDALWSHEPVWDSGVVRSSDTWISYRGPALHARARYVWAIRVWLDGAQDPTGWSEPASWEMGLLTPEDWQASWIEPNQDATVSVPYLPGRHDTRTRPKPQPDTSVLRPAQYLRKGFTVERRIARARLYSTAHGIYLASLNGVRLPIGELAPGWTPYKERLLYQTCDVTDLLSEGPNVVGFVLGDGWWAGRIGMHAVSTNYGDRLGVLAQLEIDYEDGRRVVVPTDASFKSSRGEIEYADLVMGEAHDLRKRHVGWNSAEFNDAEWTHVQPAEYANDVLSADNGGKIEVIDRLPAERIITTPDGSTVVDFGQNVAGRVRMVARGETGTFIRLEHAETLDRDGNFYDNVHALDQTNTDTVVLAGYGEEVFEPFFTFHGFRYVRVTGYPGTIRPEDFTAIVLSSATTPTATFECSDVRLNQLHRNVERTLKGSLLGVPMDNPDRERVGWTGDAAVIGDTMLKLFDLERFAESWLASLRIEQGEDGAVPLVVPFFKGYREWTMQMFGVVSCSAWGDVSVILPWALYEAYGDPRVLEVSYNSMVAWLEWESGKASASLTDEDRMIEERRHLWRVNQFHLGDWLAPSAQKLDELNYYVGDAMAKTTNPLIPIMYYANSASILAHAAKVLDRPEDHKRFSALAAGIRESFQSAFMDGDLLTSDRQGDYVLALQFDMVSPSARPALVARLVDLIGKNNDRLDTGFLSTPFLLKVLSDHGHKDLAFKLLLSEEQPSWLYQVKRGATTIWEMWNSILPDGTVTPTSQIQPALSVVSKWMCEAIGGISAEQPGYKRVLIAPRATDVLEFGRTSVTSVYGQIACAWRRAGAGAEMTIELPPGVSGCVVLEGAIPGTVSGALQGRGMLEQVACIPHSWGLATEVGSGTYEFRWSR